MYNELTLHFRALCYGGIIALFCAMIFRLVPAIRRQKSANGRYVMRLLVVAMVVLAFKNFARFFFDISTITHPGMPLPHYYGVGHFLEMIAVPFMGVSLLSLVRLKAVNAVELLMVSNPIFVAIAFYCITGDNVIYNMSLTYIIIYSIIVVALVHYHVMRYQQLLNDTYANTSQRGVTWVLTTLYVLVTLEVMWAVSAFVFPGVVSDCIYFVCSGIIWVLYSRRLMRQDFNIDVMRDIAMEQEYEAVKVNVVKEPEGTVALKAWQEPRFGEQIRAFCSNKDTFTNPELTVVDVARAVGSNRTYVSRWCKEQGTDFNSYITGIRLEYAEQLMRTTDYNVTEIMSMSGFNNPRTFRTAFVARYNCNPSEYRLRHQA